MDEKANLQESFPKKFVIFKVKDREKEARDTIYSNEKNLLKKHDISAISKSTLGKAGC